MNERAIEQINLNTYQFIYWERRQGRAKAERRKLGDEKQREKEEQEDTTTVEIEKGNWGKEAEAMKERGKKVKENT